MYVCMYAASTLLDGARSDYTHPSIHPSIHPSMLPSTTGIHGMPTSMTSMSCRCGGCCHLFICLFVCLFVWFGLAWLGFFLVGLISFVNANAGVPQSTQAGSIAAREAKAFHYDLRQVRQSKANVKCPMSNVKCQMVNVKWQMSNVKCQMPNVKCQMSNVKRQMLPQPVYATVT